MFRHTHTERTTNVQTQTSHDERASRASMANSADHQSDGSRASTNQHPPPIPSRFSQQINTSSASNPSTPDTIISQLLKGDHTTYDGRKYRIVDGQVTHLNYENKQWTPTLDGASQASRLISAPNHNDVFAIKDGNITSLSTNQAVQSDFPAEQLRHITQQGDLVGISEDGKEALIGNLSKFNHVIRIPLHLSSNEQLTDITVKDNQLYFIVKSQGDDGKDTSQLYTTSVVEAPPSTSTSAANVSVSPEEHKNLLGQWKQAVNTFAQATEELKSHQEEMERFEATAGGQTSPAYEAMNQKENVLIEKAINAEENAAAAAQALKNARKTDSNDTQGTQLVIQRPFNQIEIPQRAQNENISLKDLHHHGQNDLSIRFSANDSEFLTKVTASGVNTEEASPVHIEQDPARLGTLGDQVRSVLEKAGIQPNHYSGNFIDSSGLLDALTKRGHLSETGAEKSQDKAEIKALVDELNLQYIQGHPIKPALNLSRTEDLAPVLEKLIQQLSSMMPEETLTELQDAMTALHVLPPGKSKEAIDKVMIALAKVKAEIPKKPDTPELSNMKEVIDMLSNHLSVDSLQEAKKSLKQDIMKQFQHLNKPGASSFTLVGATVNIPTASPVTISIGAEHLEEFRTENYLTILEHRETSGTLLANIGLPKNFGIAAGGRQAANRIITHRNLEQLADDMADRIFALVLKSPIKSIFNAKQLTQLYKNVKQHNTTQNQASILNNKLHQAGLIDDSDHLTNVSGHQKKLPQKRRRYDTRVLAAGDTQIGGVVGTNLSGFVRYEKTHEYDRAKILTTMNKDPRYLEQKVKEVKSELINQLRQEAKDLEAPNNLTDTQRAQHISDSVPAIIQHREKIKEEIVKNLQTLEQYTGSVQRSDEAYRNSLIRNGLSSVNKALTKVGVTVQSEDTSSKIRTEKDMHVRGRRNMIEKLTVQHAALIKLYNDTFQHDAAVPSPNSAIDINERQFKSALEVFNKQFESPNLTLDNRDLDKLHSLTRVKVKKYAAEEAISFQAFGLRATVKAEQAYTNHVDPVKTGTGLRFNIQLQGTISRASITEIVERVQAQATQQVGEEAANEVAEEVQHTLNGQFNANISTGISGTLELDISVWNGQLDYVRLLGSSDALLNADLSQQPAAEGAANEAEEAAGDETTGGTMNFVAGTVTAVTSRRVNLVDRMGTNNLHYLHLQFNGLVSAKTVSTGDDKDAWNDIVHRYDSQLPSLIANISDPDSKLNTHYLQPLLHNDHGHYTPETLATVNRTLASLREHATEYHEAGPETTSEEKEAMLDNIINDLRDFFYNYNSSVMAGEKKKNAQLLIREPRLL